MNDKEFQYNVKQIVEQNYIKEFWCETCKCECFFIRVTQYNIDDVYRCMGCLSLCDVKPVASPYNDLRTKNVKASEELEAKRKAEAARKAEAERKAKAKAAREKAIISKYVVVATYPSTVQPGMPAERACEAFRIGKDFF